MIDHQKAGARLGILLDLTSSLDSIIVWPLKMLLLHTGLYQKKKQSNHVKCSYLINSKYTVVVLVFQFNCSLPEPYPLEKTHIYIYVYIRSMTLALSHEEFSYRHYL